MKHTVYVGLGSNQGNRQQQLEEALVYIMLYIGKIIQRSSLYETGAWGFEAPPFYNACITVETALSPQNVLAALLEIEQQMGRSRNAESGYQSRPIDLDLLSYEDRLIQTPDLELPHPRYAQRNFVLVPLAEIVPDFRHPQLQQTTTELIKVSPDTLEVNKISDPNWGPELFTGAKKFVVIEGNIGAGKTTFTEQLQQHFVVQGLYENFSDNPHLANFYQDPRRYALAVETHFLEDRCRAYAQFFTQGIPSAGAVADYTFLKSALFASQTLELDDFAVFQSRFDRLTAELQRPDLLVYIHKPVPALLAQIQKRGRPYEQQIQASYLEKLEKRYHQFLDQAPVPILYIDATTLDFVLDTTAYQQIVEQLIRA